MSKIQIVFADEVKNAMESRGISEEDVCKVLESADESGIYLREKDGNAQLAKKRIGNFTVYVEYIKQDDFLVKDVYGHRVMMAEDINA